MLGNNCQRLDAIIEIAEGERLKMEVSELAQLEELSCKWVAEEEWRSLG